MQTLNWWSSCLILLSWTHRLEPPELSVIPVVTTFLLLGHWYCSFRVMATQNVLLSQSLVTQPYIINVFFPGSVGQYWTSCPHQWHLIPPSSLVFSYFWTVLDYKICDLTSNCALAGHPLQLSNWLCPLGTGALGAWGLKEPWPAFHPVWLQVMNMQCTGNLDLIPLRGRRRRRSGDLPRLSPAIGLQPRAVSTTHLASCTQVSLPALPSFPAFCLCFWDLGKLLIV